MKITSSYKKKFNSYQTLKPMHKIWLFLSGKRSKLKSLELIDKLKLNNLNYLWSTIQIYTTNLKPNWQKLKKKLKVTNNKLKNLQSLRAIWKKLSNLSLSRNSNGILISKTMRLKIYKSRITWWVLRYT
jgi:hypothetical protein